MKARFPVTVTVVRLSGVLGALAYLVLPMAGAAQAAPPIGGPRMGSLNIVVAAGVSAPPDVADSWLVADLTTGQILAAKAPHALKRPASTLKTLTAVTFLPVFDKAQVYTAKDSDVRAEGTRVGIIENTTYTVDDLWKALLLVSANDAAHALGEVAGGQKQAAAKMQATAKSLQALDTTVVNTSGLDADHQYSSAYDLALFGRAAMQRTDFRTYVATKHSDFPGARVKGAKPGTPRPRIPIETKNKLLVDGFPGTIGVKTGYTTLAGNTYIGAVTRGGHTILITMMRTHGRLEPTAKALFGWAFAHLNAASVGTLVDPVSDQPSPSASGAPSPSAAAKPANATTPISASPTGTALPVVPIAVTVLGGGALLSGVVGLTGRERRRKARLNPLGLPPLRR